MYYDRGAVIFQEVLETASKLRQKGDMNPVPYGGPTNIGQSFIRLGDLATWLCAPRYYGIMNGYLHTITKILYSRCHLYIKKFSFCPF